MEEKLPSNVASQEFVHMHRHEPSFIHRVAQEQLLYMRGKGLDYKGVEEAEKAHVRRKRAAAFLVVLALAVLFVFLLIKVYHRFQELAGDEATTVASEFFQSTDKPGVLNVTHTWLDALPVSSAVPSARSGLGSNPGSGSKPGPRSGHVERALSSGRRRQAAPLASPPRSGRRTRGTTTTTTAGLVTASNHSDETDGEIDEETGISALSP